MSSFCCSKGRKLIVFSEGEYEVVFVNKFDKDLVSAEVQLNYYL